MPYIPKLSVNLTMFYSRNSLILAVTNATALGSALPPAIRCFQHWCIRKTILWHELTDMTPDAVDNSQFHIFQERRLDLAVFGLDE